MNHYLEILGLKPGVSEKEIKNAYRTLAKKYHPDINKDAGASARFLEISEAYKFLVDVGARPHEENITYDFDPYEDEYLKWREKAKAYAKKRQQEAEKEYRRIFLVIFRYFDYAAYLIVMVNIIWAVDFFLPYKTSEEQFLRNDGFEVIDGQKIKSRYDVVHFSNHQILVERSELVKLAQLNGTALVYTTSLFGTLIKVQTSFSPNEAHIYPVYSIYHFFGFLTPLIFIISTAYFKWTLILENKFSWAFLMLLIFLFQLKIFL